MKNNKLNWGIFEVLKFPEAFPIILCYVDQFCTKAKNI